MYKELRIAVVVPAYNEADRLTATLSTVPEFVDHIVVVDDGSTDATFAVATSCVRRGIDVLRHAENRGVGAAVATGYKRALSLQSDVAVVMAGDGQMDPEDVPVLLDPIAEGRADYVKGNRFAKKEVLGNMPLLRVCGNVALSLVTRWTAGYPGLFDSQCGFTAVTRNTLGSIDLDGLYPRYGYPNDLLARLWVSRARVLDVPVRTIYGASWRSGITVKTAIYPVLFVAVKAWPWRLWTRWQNNKRAAGSQMVTNFTSRGAGPPSRRHFFRRA
ncbi:MAG TPA: glycosyltransferase family 2 protein [Pseudomonadota bacterium]|nr:glycosyltransferase family 2 protein [Pseudomonadota bacterium]